jgi:hypothetical protein
MNQLPLIGLDPDRPFAVIGGDGHSYRVIDVFDISSIEVEAESVIFKMKTGEDVTFHGTGAERPSVSDFLNHLILNWASYSDFK